MFYKKILIFLIVIATVLWFAAGTAEAVSVTATPGEGGKTSMITDEKTGASIEILPGGVTTNTKIKITTKYRTDPLLSGYTETIKSVPSGKYIVGKYLYNFVAEVVGGRITTFAKPFNITLIYTDELIENMDEPTLTVNYWDDEISEWVVLDTVVDIEGNALTVTTSQLNYFRLPITLEGLSLFAIFGEEPGREEEIIEEEEEEEIEEEEIEEEEIEEETEEKPVSEMTTEELQAKITEILAQINALQTQLSGIKGVTYEGIPANFTFENNLRYGQTSDEVKYLQIILKKEIGPPVYPADISTTGWLGSITKQSVIKFQEKYSSEILVPFGITAGTGFVGRTTRAKLNSLLGG